MVLRRLACSVVAFAVIVTAAVLSTPSPVHSQELVGRCIGLFNCLFRRPAERVEPQRVRPAERSRPKSRARKIAPRAAAPAPPPEPVIEKLDNARVVLVVGDFLANGLAEGLTQAYAKSPGVRVVDRTNGSSGFVRNDYYDWNKEIGSILDEIKPAVVVVMIGSNDRQQIKIGDKREDPRSEAWLNEYDKRVTNFAEAVRKRDIPLVWTGLPPFKSSSMTSDMLAFNDIYKQTAEQVGGEFVDIWDGFVDENGSFVFTGPDMNGQPVRLRGSDGINLTRPAKRKVAFFVEKPLAKILGKAVLPDIGKLDMENLPTVEETPIDPALLDRTPPMSLGDPDLDGSSVLLGATVDTTRDEPRTAGQKLLADGLVPTGAPGRADDFSLRKLPLPKAETATDGETTTAIRR
nr:DUF459 domain-containing protein [Mesorhizobium sp. J18]